MCTKIWLWRVHLRWAADRQIDKCTHTHRQAGTHATECIIPSRRTPGRDNYALINMNESLSLVKFISEHQLEAECSEWLIHFLEVSSGPLKNVAEKFDYSSCCQDLMSLKFWSSHRQFLQQTTLELKYYHSLNYGHLEFGQFWYFFLHLVTFWISVPKPYLVKRGFAFQLMLLINTHV